MTTFSSSNSFGRGEIDESLQDLRGQDFYGAAAAYIENWYPDRVGGLFKRPAVGFGAILDDVPVVHGHATGSIAPNSATPVSLSQRTISVPSESTTYDYTSQDLYMQVVELSGVSVAIFVETLTRTMQDEATAGNCVLVSAQFIQPGGVQLSSDQLTIVTEKRFFLNANNGEFDEGFPYNTPGGMPDLTPPLSQLVRIAVAGPAAFIATSRMEILRVYIDGGALKISSVDFFEELAGTLTASEGDSAWTGTDSLFGYQMNPGDIILFDGDTYEVANITDATNLTTTTPATSSITATGAVLRPSIFGGYEFPAQVTFYQNRLVLASTRGKPTGVWLSESSNPFVILGSNVEADSPINYELFAPEATAFKWMTSTDRVYLGGSQSEFSIGEPGVAITPTNFPVTRIGTTGSSALSAKVTDTSFLHVGRYGQHVYAVQFDLSRQAFDSSDITFLSSRLFDKPVKSFSYRAASTQDPTPRVYAVLEGGEVRTAAYAPNLNLLAWSRITSSNQFARVLQVTSSSLATYFVVRDRAADCYEIWVDTGTSGAAAWGDLQTPAQVDSQMEIEVSQPFLNGVLTITTAAADPVILGYVTVGTSTTVDVSHLDVAPGDFVYYMFAYDAVLRMLPVAASDARGPMLNRKRRLVRALVDVLNSVQIYVNSRPLLPEVNPHALTFTGVYSTRMLGWNYSDELEVTAPTIYRARIRSITREVST